MERVILHCDANSFYVSCELYYRSELRELPVAVGGDVEASHGIIITANLLAKKYGVRTGNTLWEARQKCPKLVILPAYYPLYFHFSKQMTEIFFENLSAPSPVSSENSTRLLEKYIENNKKRNRGNEGAPRLIRNGLKLKAFISRSCKL